MFRSIYITSERGGVDQHITKTRELIMCHANKRGHKNECRVNAVRKDLDERVLYTTCYVRRDLHLTTLAFRVIRP
jgi:hypothetical protein